MQAVKSPTTTTSVAFKNGISKNAPIADPVQTPVIGTGKATKAYKPSIFLFSIWDASNWFALSSTPFALDLKPSSMASTIALNTLNFFNQFIIGLNIARTIGLQIAEPKNANPNAAKTFIPIAIAIGIEPLTSTNGIIETMKTVI